MAGFEVIVRPMIFPSIRPAPARSLPPEDDPEKGFAVIHGGSGQHVDLAYSWGWSMSKSKPVETERRVDEARVYQKDDGGTVNRDNFVDVQVANKIKMKTPEGFKGFNGDDLVPTPGRGYTGDDIEKEYFFQRLKEKDNIKIKRKNVVIRNGEEVKAD